jgi:hypothetical protein
MQRARAREGMCNEWCGKLMHEFHILKQERRPFTRAWKHFICDFQIKDYIYEYIKCPPRASNYAFTRLIIDRRIRSVMPGLVAVILTGIHSAAVKRPFVVNRSSCSGVHTIDLISRSAEAMQSVL